MEAIEAANRIATEITQTVGVSLGGLKGVELPTGEVAVCARREGLTGSIVVVNTNSDIAIVERHENLDDVLTASDYRDLVKAVDRAFDGMFVQSKAPYVREEDVASGVDLPTHSPFESC